MESDQIAEYAEQVLKADQELEFSLKSYEPLEHNPQLADILTKLGKMQGKTKEMLTIPQHVIDENASSQFARSFVRKNDHSYNDDFIEIN